MKIKCLFLKFELFEQFELEALGGNKLYYSKL